MTTILQTSASAFYRCAAHGLWFDKQSRFAAARDFGLQIENHRQLREIVGLLRRGDDASLRAFARMFMSLSTQVGELRRELQRL